jgi:serine O-acetyltransferase
MKLEYGLEISRDVSIESGLYLGHAYNITINPNAVLGSNVNIHKGVTIGQENRGKRQGSPKIGNKVWIGINSTIVGKITIGNDVLVAPNSYVNIDIPSHSIVVGNPCRIISSRNATLKYIINTI